MIAPPLFSKLSKAQAIDVAVPTNAISVPTLTGWLSLPQQGPSATLVRVRVNGDLAPGMSRSGPTRVLALADFDGQVFRIAGGGRPVTFPGASP